ncbi:MAG: hypothetical protein IJ091_10595 [Oscillospiraceae bacterium]|nr:hypothetical protein [Oscillospiraceae bacterium]
MLQLIQKKYRRKLMKENGKELVFAALARRGFRMSSIRNVLGKVDVEDYGE